MLSFVLSLSGMADQMNANGLKLICDYGTNDFLIEVNRELHRRLTLNQTPHTDSERSGGLGVLANFTSQPRLVFQ